MKAKLVTFTITTRVVVEDNATDEEIAAIAVAKTNKHADGYLSPDFLDEIRDDTECPYRDGEHSTKEVHNL